MNTSSYFLTQFGFAAVTIVFAVLLLITLKRALAKTTIDAQRQRKLLLTTTLLLSVWFVAMGIGAITGFFRDFNSLPPRVTIIVIIPLVVVIWLLNNKTATEIIHAMSPHRLMSLQVFRVFVEVLLWALFAQGLLPEQMTFEGRNFDVISGITGPVMAWLVYRQKVSKGVAIVWNLLCLGLLINIVGTAILSMPTPFRVFMNEPANTIVTEFPIIWLPGFLVPLAYTLHLLSLKQLLKQ